ncbi:MAG: hypothetical protein HS115_03115 [Spirochaetales bacterium]|nr:hypothetical protein [Spirochaetales bacterium]
MAEEAKAAARAEIVVDHARALRAFASPNVDFGIVHPAPFKTHIRVLGQIYDTIQRFLIGETRKTDSFYPETDELYRDLQLLKRSISDKTPMPSPEQFRQLLRLLATTEPPFIHFVRELTFGGAGFVAATVYVAPTEKHPDKVQVAYQAALRNSANAVKDLINKHYNNDDFEEQCKTLNRVEDLRPARSRADAVLRTIFLRDEAIAAEDREEQERLRRINEQINRFLYRPLMQQLFREGHLLSLSTQAYRQTGIPGADRLTDFMFFNEPERLQSRLQQIVNLLDSNFCWPYLPRDQVDDLRSSYKAEERSMEDFAESLGELVLQSLKSADRPAVLLELGCEAILLSRWQKDYLQKKEQTDAQDAWQKILSRLKKHGNMVRVTRSRLDQFLPDQLKEIIAGRVASILCLTDPVDRVDNAAAVDLRSYNAVFLLLKDRQCTAGAIDSAVELFRKSGDPYLIRVLEMILNLDTTADEVLKNYVAPAYLLKLREAAAESYWPMLPWWQRIYYTLTGRDVSHIKLDRLKKALRIQQEKTRESRQARRDKEARQSAEREIKSRARSNLRQVAAADAPPDTGPLRQSIESKLRQGIFPVRQMLLDDAGPERKTFEQLLGLIDVGAQSVRSIRRITLPVNEPVYVTEEMLEKNRDLLLDICERGSTEVTEVQLASDVKVALSDPSRGKRQLSREDYRALAQFIERS